MTRNFEQVCEGMDRDDRFRATVYAMNTNLIRKGIYTQGEFEEGFIAWVEREERKRGPITERDKAKLIVERVAHYFGLTVEEMQSKRNFRKLVRPRWVAWYLLTEVCGWPRTQIGRRFGGFDHSTVLHGLRGMARELEANAGIRNLVEQVKSELVAQ